jgi:hypothetical protein
VGLVRLAKEEGQVAWCHKRLLEYLAVKALGALRRLFGEENGYMAQLDHQPKAVAGILRQLAKQPRGRSGKKLGGKKKVRTRNDPS